MTKLPHVWISLALVLLVISCSVISQGVRSEADPSVPFRTLIENVDRYIGQTVILGGYILQTQNLESKTILKVLQSPLKFGEEPDLKRRSQGRFMVYHNGFLDPEVYGKDQAITVAGRVIGSAEEQIGDDRMQYLKIENREIYLWPDYKNKPPLYYPWPYPTYWDPYPYWYW